MMDEVYACAGEENKKDERTLSSQIVCLSIHNERIKVLNITTNQWKDLPNVFPSKRKHNFVLKQRRVVNVCNAIYYLDYGRVVKFVENGTGWIKKKSRSKKPSGFAEVTVVQQHIYVIERDVMACYDVDGDSWEERLPGCGLGSFFCAASSDEFIYTMGGKMNSTPSADVKQFDLATQSYSTITGMTTARSGACAEVFHEMVFVVGGSNGEEYLNSVEVYQPTDRTWTELVKSTCVRRYLASACVANNRLYAVGGACDEKGKRLNPNSIEVCDEDTKEWELMEEYDWKIGFTPCCAANLHFDENE